jgi:hypothetical protein
MRQSTQLRRLLEGFVENSLTDEEFQTLNTLLREDPAARRKYYEHLSLDHLLAERYELPDYIAMHAQAMDNPHLNRRFRTQPLAWSLGGAAAAVIAILTAFFLIRAAPPQATFTTSADCHFLLDSKLNDGDKWSVGELLEIRSGTAAVALTPYIEACLEGPCRIRCLDPQGNVELIEGRAFFQVAPGGTGFEVHTPGGLLRDIGTQFGVEVHPGGMTELHVSSGIVQITPQDQKTPIKVQAGEAMRWKPGATPESTPIDTDRFLLSLPHETLIFSDDFSDPNGTRMHGKRPDIGQPWIISLEHNATLARDGAFDTSFSPRTATANFNDEPFVDRKSVHLVTFRTRPPENIDDKAGYTGASEQLTIGSAGGYPLFSLFAEAATGHTWKLRSEEDGRIGKSTTLHAFDPNLLTISYHRETGRVALHQGGSARGPLIDEIHIRPGESPAFLTASNTEGGDLSLDDIQVKVVSYPHKIAKPN